MRRLPFLVAILALAACGPTAPVSPSAPASPPPASSPSPAASPSPTASPTPALSAADLSGAANRTVDAGTARMDIKLTFEGSSLMQEGMGLTGEGQVSFGEPRQFSISMDMRDFGIGVMDVIVDDRLIYIRGASLERITGEDQWLVVDLDSTHPAAADFVALGSGQNDNALSVYYLYGVDGPIRFLGTERIAGVGTERVGVRLDLEKALDRVPSNVRAALEENINKMLDEGVQPTIEAEAWLGDDGFVHRVRYEYTLTQRMGGGKMVGVFDLSEFGEPLELKIPGTFEIVKLEDVVPED